MSALDPILDAPTRETHVIPVDASLTPDEAWAEICRNGTRVTYTAAPVTWAAIECDGVECLGVVADAEA